MNLVRAVDLKHESALQLISTAGTTIPAALTSGNVRTAFFQSEDDATC